MPQKWELIVVPIAVARKITDRNMEKIFFTEIKGTTFTEINKNGFCNSLSFNVNYEIDAFYIIYNTVLIENTRFAKLLLLSAFSFFGF